MATTDGRPGQKLLPLDWGALAPLRIRAAAAAEGVYAGAHRSSRRGAGIEFGGQRPYVPGDDLRFLDRRSLMRHDRLMIREFETDTERALWLAVDTSASMGFRGGNAPGAKLAYAAVLGAALCKVAISGQDPVGLAWLGRGRSAGSSAESSLGRESLHAALGPAGFGGATFDRVVFALERVTAHGALEDDLDALDRQLTVLARRARRGSVVVLFSDFLDVPAAVLRRMALLGSERVLVAVQVLDPVEADFGFAGQVRLRAMEGDAVVTTDADRVRAEYLARLDAHTNEWRGAVEEIGGRFVRARTDEATVEPLRRIVQAVREARR